MRFIVRAQPISAESLLRAGDYELVKYTIRLTDAATHDFEQVPPIEGPPVSTYLTIPEANRATGLQTRLLRRLIRTGQLKGVKIGGRWHISRTSLKELLEQGESGPE
jgi:excisionase family DNA binding protein